MAHHHWGSTTLGTAAVPLRGGAKCIPAAASAEKLVARASRMGTLLGRSQGVARAERRTLHWLGVGSVAVVLFGVVGRTSAR